MGTNQKPPEGYDEVEFDNNGGDDDDDDVSDLAEIGPVVGTVVNIKSGEDDRGPWYLVTVLDDEDGLVKFWAKWDVKRAIGDGAVKENTEACFYVDDSDKREKPGDGEEVPAHKVAFPGGDS